MANRILSLDIQEDLLSGVVVEQRPAELIVHSCASVKVDDPGQLSAAVSELLGRFDIGVDGCIIGLPLSVVSFRNLNLPFTDRKKLAQVLPLELEEQLLAPVDQQIIDFVVTGKNDEGSQVLVAAVEKDLLGRLLSAIGTNKQPVWSVATTLEVIVRENMSGDGAGDVPTLFLHGDPHAIDMAFWVDGKVVFMRRIAFPEPVFTTPLGGHGEIELTVDRKTAEQYIHEACEHILQSLYYAGRAHDEPLEAQQVIVSGCLTGAGSWQPFIGRQLALPVTIWKPIQDISKMRLAETAQGRWNHWLYDSALVLAVSGLRNKKKQPGLAFLKGEFAPGPIQLFSRRSLSAIAAGIGLILLTSLALLWYGYRSLDGRASSLHEQMIAIYKQTFPGATRVNRPFLQMQSKLREVQGAEVSLPLFSGEKRALTILADISSRIPKDLSLHVSRLVIDQESVQIKGVTDAFNNVDVIKNRLAGSSRYVEVKIVSAAADKKKGKIRFEIRMLLGEAS